MVLFLCSCFAWFLLGNWLWPLLHPDEGRYVGIAAEMLHAREWGTPLLNGMPYFHKPPLFYWLTAGSLAIFGENEFAARIVPAVSGWLMVVGLLLFVRRFSQASLAWTAAMILAVSPLVFAAAHYANMDLLVASMICLTILCGAASVLREADGQQDQRWLMFMYFFAGLGFLAKGLIGVVLPAGVLFFWLLSERRFRAIGRLLRPQGVVLLLVLVMPWLLLMETRYPGFLHYYLIYQQFQRFSEGGFNNAMPVWFYLAVLLVSALPWLHAGSIVLFTRKDRQGRQRASLRRLMWIWLLLILAFFSLPQSKLVGYILPVFPPLAFLLAETFQAEPSGSAGSKANEAPSVSGILRRRFILGTVGCALLALLAVVSMSMIPRPNSKNSMASIRNATAVLPGTPTERFYSLDFYPFDFPFYAKAANDLTVVSDWRASNIGVQDNWQKELWDARDFDRTASAGRFMPIEAFMTSLCSPKPYRRWLLADSKKLDSFPVFVALQPYFRDANRSVYLLEPGKTMPFCARAPAVGG